MDDFRKTSSGLMVSALGEVQGHTVRRTAKGIEYVDIDGNRYYIYRLIAEAFSVGTELAAYCKNVLDAATGRTARMVHRPVGADVIRLIRQQAAGGMGICELARALQLDAGYVSKVVNNKIRRESRE